MLTDKEFLDFIGDKSLDGSLEESLNRLIDDEMEKSEEEMDADLIEYCLNKLNYLDEKALSTPKKKGESKDKHVRLRFKKVIAIAAIISVLFICTLTAAGSAFDIKLFDGIVELYNEYVRINFNKIDGEAGEYKLLETELAKELAENGFDKVLLPEAIFSRGFEVTKTEYETGELITCSNISIKHKNKMGYIYIRQYAVQAMVEEYEFLHVTSDIKMLQVGNTTIFCFTQSGNTTITYRDGLSIYLILVPLELDDAIEFAKTIK